LDATAVGQWLGLSDRTVRERLRTLYGRIGASNLGQAAWLLQERLVGDPAGTVSPSQAGAAQPRQPRPTPTPMQREVLLLVAISGLPRAAVAQRLGISRLTVRNQLLELYGRVGARNMGQAVWLLRDELARPG
jgi:DNA-binding NarL/FixJ family response regulator